MENTEIYENVKIEFAKWKQLQLGLLGRELDISEGAINVISQMVINIIEDPSHSWRENINKEEIQAYAISIIPNILNDILRHDRYPRYWSNRVTSWEILHGISRALDSWCPIPKDF